VTRDLLIDLDGVKNMISCFDFSSRAPTVEASAELEVSKDDSVTCLANLATKDGLVVFAGNGSSVEDKIQGKDMSFKAFEVQLPKNKGTSVSEEKPGHISFLSKTQILTTQGGECEKRGIHPLDAVITVATNGFEYAQQAHWRHRFRPCG
jgi:prolactin regulatory element-binding protein